MNMAVDLLEQELSTAPYFSRYPLTEQPCSGMNLHMEKALLHLSWSAAPQHGKSGGFFGQKIHIKA